MTDSDFLQTFYPSIWHITCINSDVSKITHHVIVNLPHPVLIQCSINTSPDSNLPPYEFQSPSTATTSTLNSTSKILQSTLVLKSHGNTTTSDVYSTSDNDSSPVKKKYDTFDYPIFIESGIVHPVLHSPKNPSVLNTVSETFDKEQFFKANLIS